MSKQGEEKIYQQTWDQFGNLQYAVALEELAELQKAITKIWRKGVTEETHKDLLEEMADVLIIIGQIRVKYGIKEREIDAAKNAKLERLRLRLESGYYLNQVVEVNNK